MANWCEPVGWSPASRIDGAEWLDGAWVTADSEAAGLVVYGHRDDAGEEIEVGLDDLRVVRSGDCRVIGEVEVA